MNFSAAACLGGFEGAQKQHHWVQQQDSLDWITLLPIFLHLFKDALMNLVFIFALVNWSLLFVNLSWFWSV